MVLLRMLVLWVASWLIFFRPRPAASNAGPSADLQRRLHDHRIDRIAAFGR